MREERNFYVFSNEHHRETYIERMKGESANDRNDRAIRAATIWYQQHLKGVAEVVLLTNDVSNKTIALENNLKALSISQFLSSFHKSSPLQDLLAPSSSLEREGANEEGEEGKEGKYEAHMSLEKAKEEVREGRLYKCRIYINEDNINEGRAIHEDFPQGILVQGVNLNRAVDSDIVALSLLPQHLWSSPLNSLSLDPLSFLSLLPPSQNNSSQNEEKRIIGKVQENTSGILEENTSGILEENTGGILEENTSGVLEENTRGTVGENTRGTVRENEEKRATGKVVAILERQEKKYCGGVVEWREWKEWKERGDEEKRRLEELLKKELKGGEVLVLALERKVPPVKVKLSQPHLFHNKRILFSIDFWERNASFPSGHFVRELEGNLNETSTETETIELQYSVRGQPFHPNILKELPDPHFTPSLLPKEELLMRRDLRGENIVSIDPPGCTDIDDALHFKQMGGGEVEVGVHIADVSYFVKEGSETDKEARKRGVTCYLVNKRIDMLPSLLGTNLCSLQEGKERLAFSVVWRFNEKQEVVKVEFFKSIISSKKAFTYKQAQQRISDPSLNDPITLSLRGLQSLARSLKEKRLSNGALSLSSPAVRFSNLTLLQYKETNEAKQTKTPNKQKEEERGRGEEEEIVSEPSREDPIEMELYESVETNSLVEEFMLLANVTVGKKIYTSFPNKALLRSHMSPLPSSFDSLLFSLSKKGFHLKISSSKELQESLDECVDEKDPYFNTLVRILTTRCMLPAKYFSSGKKAENEFNHFGLAASIYTHFTSPIRRYADVIVHRQLAACINAAPPPLLDSHSVQTICNTINHRHRMAQMAGRSSVSLFTLLFFLHKNVTELAYITKVGSNGFTVLIPRYGFESTLLLSSFPSSSLLFDPPSNTLFLSSPSSPSSPPLSFNVFDKVLVSVSVDDSQPIRRKLNVQFIKKVESEEIPQLLELKNSQKIQIEKRSTKEGEENLENETKKSLNTKKRKPEEGKEGIKISNETGTNTAEKSNMTMENIKATTPKKKKVKGKRKGSLKNLLDQLK